MTDEPEAPEAPLDFRYPSLVAANGSPVVLYLTNGQSVIGKLVDVSIHEVAIDNTAVPDQKIRGLWRIPLQIVAFWVQLSQVELVKRVIQ